MYATAVLSGGFYGDSQAFNGDSTRFAGDSQAFCGDYSQFPGVSQAFCGDSTKAHRMPQHLGAIKLPLQAPPEAQIQGNIIALALRQTTAAH